MFTIMPDVLGNKAKGGNWVRGHEQLAESCSLYDSRCENVIPGDF